MTGETEPKRLWLPENYVLRLTAFECGALVPILQAAKQSGVGTFAISKPGPDGEPVETTMVDRLTEKLLKTVKEHEC